MSVGLLDLLNQIATHYENGCAHYDDVVSRAARKSISRIEALEAENARLRAQLNPRFDEYGHYGENNPPVGAPSTREPTTPTLRWVWNAVPIKGHIGGPFVAEQVLQQCVRDADGNMIWQDVGENSLPVQGGTGE